VFLKFLLFGSIIKWPQWSAEYRNLTGYCIRADIYIHTHIYIYIHTHTHTHDICIDKHTLYPGINVNTMLVLHVLDQTLNSNCKLSNVKCFRTS
jgi:hypothetical protein